MTSARRGCLAKLIFKVAGPNGDCHCSHLNLSYFESGVPCWPYIPAEETMPKATCTLQECSGACASDFVPPLSIQLVCMWSKFRCLSCHIMRGHIIPVIIVSLKAMHCHCAAALMADESQPCIVSLCLSFSGTIALTSVVILLNCRELLIRCLCYGAAERGLGDRIPSGR